MVNFMGVLIKATHNCNLDCQYCYDKPYREKYGSLIMSDEIFKKAIDVIATHAHSIAWIWHGGEPTIVGTKFYEDKQEHFCKYFNNKIEQSFQSNGTLLNKDWVELFNNYGIGGGISFDCAGQDIRSSKYDIAKNIEYYASEIKCAGVISVINYNNYDKLIESYNMAKNQLKVSSLAYNYIFQSEGAEKNNLALSIEKYIPEYKKFANYYMHDKNPINERLTENHILMLFNIDTGICTYSDCRKNWLGIGPSGEIMPCDRHLPDNEFTIGNIMDYDSVEKIHLSNGFKKYYNVNQKRFDNICSKCAYWSKCNGGCCATHLEYDKTGNSVDLAFCNSFKVTQNIVYGELNNLDIYNNTINPQILKILAEKNKFLPIEIKLFLNKKGFYFKQYSTDEIIELESNLFQTKEYKIFNLFNKETATCLSNLIQTENYQEYLLKYAAEEREKLLETIFSEQYIEFLKIYTTKETY